MAYLGISYAHPVPKASAMLRGTAWQCPSNRRLTIAASSGDKGTTELSTKHSLDRHHSHWASPELLPSLDLPTFTNRLAAKALMLSDASISWHDVCAGLEALSCKFWLLAKVH